MKYGLSDGVVSFLAPYILGLESIFQNRNLSTCSINAEDDFVSVALLLAVLLTRIEREIS